MAHARSEISLREKSAQKNRWQDRPDSHNNTGLYTSTDATRRARTFCKRLLFVLAVCEPSRPLACPLVEYYRSCPEGCSGVHLSLGPAMARPSSFRIGV